MAGGADAPQLRQKGESDCDSNLGDRPRFRVRRAGLTFALATSRTPSPLGDRHESHSLQPSAKESSPAKRPVPRCRSGGREPPAEGVQAAAPCTALSHRSGQSCKLGRNHCLGRRTRGRVARRVGRRRASRGSAPAGSAAHRATAYCLEALARAARCRGRVRLARIPAAVAMLRHHRRNFRNPPLSGRAMLASSCNDTCS